MKTIKLILLGIALLSFIACNDDDGLNEQSIQGEWILNDLTYKSKSTFTSGGIDTVIEQDAEYIEGDQSINFSEDGTYTSSGNIICEVDNYQNRVFISTEEINYADLGVDLISSGVWRIEENQLVLDNETQQQISVEGDIMTITFDQDFDFSPEFRMELEGEFSYIKQ